MAGNKNSGNRTGLPRQREDRPFFHALRREMAKNSVGDHDAYAQLAQRLMRKAAEGDMQAIKELIDRLDGKSIQQTENHNINEHSFAVVGPEVTDDQWKKMLDEIRNTDAPVVRRGNSKSNGNGAKNGAH